MHLHASDRVDQVQCPRILYTNLVLELLVRTTTSSPWKHLATIVVLMAHHSYSGKQVPRAP